MFKDLAKIKVRAGKGGDGHVSFNGAKRYPNGGDGGKGGDVYLEGTINLYDLSFIKADTLFQAENAENGKTNNLQGADGKDLVIKVPLTTVVMDLDKKPFMSITKPGEKKLLLKGGTGGLGNYVFRSEGVDSLNKFTSGKAGQEQQVILQLELYSDILFIGFPNAGKSSILNELTNADSKVAAYAFTTTIPHLGRMDGVTLMDLPGLIEGTFQGKGLGTSFVKHTKWAQYVAHFVSTENENVTEAYQTMRNELKAIDEDLFKKNEIIVLTKSDLVDKKSLEEKKKKLEKFGKVVVASAYDFDSIENLNKEFKKLLSNSSQPSLDEEPK
jgi:GTP-binding protein